MKTKQLFWGFYFLTLGVLFLLAQAFSIQIAENFLWDSWPLLLILLGIIVMVRGHVVKTVFTILLALAFALFSFGIVQDFFGPDEDVEWESIEEANPTSEYYEYNSSIKFADFNFTADWGKLTITNKTDKLWEVFSSEANREVSSTSEMKGEKLISEIRYKQERSSFWNKHRENFEIRLNVNPVWNLNFKLGAASSVLNLKKFKVKNLKINTGASDVKIFFGNKYPVTNLEINAGAANVTVYIPKESGCKIKGKSFLISRSLPGFTEDSNGDFVNKNFENSENKILITLKSAAITFKVKSY